MDAETQVKSWEDAFQKYPISSIRTIEKQLRSNVLGNREKLRALVGDNYRDLLSTAEQIVELDYHTRRTESSISALGQACQPSLVKTSGIDSPKLVPLEGLLKFLDASLRCASAAAKRRALLLAAKLTVISRLTLKHLVDLEIPERTTAWMQKCLRATRQALLTMIDLRIKLPIASTQMIGEALTAFSLLTSSSSTDSLKHFLQIRVERLSQGLDETATKASRSKEIRVKCHYLIATVTIYKLLSGRMIADLLNELQKRPLLKSNDVLDLDILHLDFYQTFLPSDVRAFTPYFKRITPTSSETRAVAEAWTTKAFDAIMDDFESYISEMKLSGILRARQNILDTLLPSYFSALLQESAIAKIKTICSKYIIRHIEGLGKNVESISQSMLTTSPSDRAVSFWNSSVIRPDKARSTGNYVNALRSSHLGIYDDLHSNVIKISKWARSCKNIQEELIKLTKVRWRDKLEDYGDDDEEEAQEIVDSLTKQDPQMYLTNLTTVLETSANNVIQGLTETTKKICADTPTDASVNAITDMLRMSREVRTILQQIVPAQDLTDLSNSVMKLHETLARKTSSNLFDLMETTSPKSSQMFSADDLPSPLAIHVLQNLSNIMLEIGGMDLWTATAVKMVRESVFQRVTSEDYSKYYIASEFDKYYLTAALSTSGNEDRATANPVARKANAYWYRTRTLFGIFDATIG